MFTYEKHLLFLLYFCILVIIQILSNKYTYNALEINLGSILLHSYNLFRKNKQCFVIYFE